MDSRTLDRKIMEREAYWRQELRELPEEYTPSNWQRMKFIQEILRGLSEMRTKFVHYGEPPAVEVPLY